MKKFWLYQLVIATVAFVGAIVMLSRMGEAGLAAILVAPVFLLAGVGSAAYAIYAAIKLNHSRNAQPIEDSKKDYYKAVIWIVLIIAVALLFGPVWSQLTINSLRNDFVEMDREYCEQAGGRIEEREIKSRVCVSDNGSIFGFPQEYSDDYCEETYDAEAKIVTNSEEVCVFDDGSVCYVVDIYGGECDPEALLE